MPQGATRYILSIINSFFNIFNDLLFVGVLIAYREDLLCKRLFLISKTFQNADYNRDISVQEQYECFEVHNLLSFIIVPCDRNYVTSCTGYISNRGLCLRLFRTK